jgi:hypothetical protein
MSLAPSAPTEGGLASRRTTIQFSTQTAFSIVDGELRNRLQLKVFLNKRLKKTYFKTKSLP